VALAPILAYLPSPPDNGVSIGPLRLHVYGLLIAVGILTAVWVAQRQWDRVGGKLGTMSMLAVWGVPGGLIGARVYSLATSWNVDTGGHLIRGFEIWRGGLGIWGGVAGGVASGLYGAYRHGLPFKPLLDAVAPAFPFAQAVGRWGNYFNQELYGRRTTLPWGLHIDGLAGHYQPTFLYECIWDVIVGFLVLYATKHLRLRRGYLFALYAALYTFGRFFTEYLRIDEAHRFWGLRLNDWTSIIVCVVATALLVARGRPAPGDDLAGAPLPSGMTSAAVMIDADPETDADATVQGGEASGMPAGESVADAGVEPDHTTTPGGRTGPAGGTEPAAVAGEPRSTEGGPPR
jgi:prolipoprotein diacylglyceryl transferase